MVRLCLVMACAAVLAGCAPGGDAGGSAAPLTADPKLNSCLARLSVTRCNLASVPAPDAGPVKARAALGVRGKDSGTGAGGSRAVNLRAYDPATGTATGPDADGNLLVPIGGTLIALGGAGGAALWYFDHKKDSGGGGGEIDIVPGEDVPVSLRSNRPPDPDRVEVTATTPDRTVDCTPVAVTDSLILATAPLTEADAGPIRLTGRERGEVIAEEMGDAVLSQIRWTPELVEQGQIGTLSGTFLPAGRNIRVVLSLNCESTVQPLKPCQITGSPGAWTVTFEGNAGQLSQGGLLAAQATSPEGIEAGAQVEEIE
ncbi:MAG: hypothetical protein HUU15_05020 [Candidatus Brocadiae bacterium]|nr:hypothetical protein [Candidatus Brocadiia bacterium]